MGNDVTSNGLSGRRRVILVVSNAADATADFFEDRLAASGVAHHRLNTEELARLAFSFSVDGRGAQFGASAIFSTGAGRISLDEIASIYYRRPVQPRLPDGTPPGLADWMESEVRRAWGGLLASHPGIRWVNHPLAVSGASYKPEQLARAKRIGLAVPDTLITTDPQKAADFCTEHDWRVVAKPVGHGEILGATAADDRIVYTNRIPREAASRLGRVANCPTLLQCEILKDVDVRVTVVEREVVAVALHSQERPVSIIDCRRDNMAGMRYSLITLPAELASALADLVASYGLLYAAIDLVRDQDGRYWFLELNPAGQWAWLEQVADAPISAAIIRCLTHG